jgi:hypothetical protein
MPARERITMDQDKESPTSNTASSYTSSMFRSPEDSENETYYDIDPGIESDTLPVNSNSKGPVSRTTQNASTSGLNIVDERTPLMESFARVKNHNQKKITFGTFK